MAKAAYGESNVVRGAVYHDVGLDLAAPVVGRNPREEVWKSLVVRMAQGDQQALSVLYDETSSVVYTLALRIVGNREDAEETVLDAYSRAWKMAGRYEPDRGGVMAWLVMMSRSIAIDRLRSGATRASKTTSLAEGRDWVSDAPGPELVSALGERREKIRAALEELPGEQCQAIELAFFGGLTHAELSERLGIPLGTVKTRVRLGLMRLRGALGGAH